MDNKDVEPDGTWLSMNAFAKSVGVNQRTIRVWIDRKSYRRRLLYQKSTTCLLMPPKLQKQYMVFHGSKRLEGVKRVNRFPKGYVRLSKLKCSKSFLKSKVHLIDSLVWYRNTYYVSPKDAKWLNALYTDARRAPVGYVVAEKFAIENHISIHTVKKFFYLRKEKLESYLSGQVVKSFLSPEQQEKFKARKES